MGFDFLHPTTARLIDLLNEQTLGAEVPRAQIVREFNVSWRKLEPYFRSAVRVLLRDHGKVVILTPPRGSGPVVVCTDKQKVEVETKHIKGTRQRNRKTRKIVSAVDTTVLEPAIRNKHEANQFIAATVEDLLKPKTINALVKRASNDELKPSEEMLKFLAS